MEDLLPKSEAQYAKQVYAEQVRMVYGSFMTAIGGTFVGAFFLILVQWDVVNHKTIYIWFGICSLFHLIRAVFVYRFNQTLPDDDACITWGQGFVYSSLVAGLIWGVGIFITFIDNDLPHQLTVAIITVGLCAGAVSSISVLRRSFLLFVPPIMLTLTILFILEMTYTTNILSIIIFLIMLFIMRGSHNLYLSNKANFRLLLEAADREKKLVIAKDLAEIAKKTQSEFLDRISHELRTPLHGILAFADIGADKAKDISDENFINYFSKIADSGERLNTLLDDLLDLRSLEEGKTELNFHDADILSIIKKCADEQDALIQSHNLHIVFNFNSELPLINCDKDRIGQVIINILSNAIKFTPQGEHIIISVSVGESLTTNSKAVHIKIIDKGPGVPEVELESIFNKFVQVENNASFSCDAGLGLGLGLAISKEIINQHKGNIWCENNENGGATFHVILPIKN